MSDDVPTAAESFFTDWRKQIEVKQQKHKAIVESDDYQRELKRLSQITTDFIGVLSVCWIATTRAGDWVNKSFFMRSVDDLNQSAIMARNAVHEGARNSARRELRYKIE